ncbi:haloacid dehalogenase superfamily, subfamily IA, variant 3 with third motif having DD or ED/beta-phosphoglucomutase family hydrolase [Parafrankia irregularis]|uniref:Haloacid dehalogenase superfamily, subfamily IA, variant 3 with third motif having DD or ED/beta-phosphoglucomutase family hydrolase n=1 Tax=Parafrankia irregularis TaxID=795642 RepID=A0A0S4QQ23_9ACTN|nr:MULTISPECIES: HAD-IA family hydrolase [Parafrankia]MBE3204509.1 HAD-IA family hydrolase [Parafrankia sp. CH37]CUU57787.1 haloacid dehalogenase superfamily, subfamily IA, variant 3 with third motif having DD or ED/beta-phosphoglucomutase family hydrolase [Parafrankia irregularis]
MLGLPDHIRACLFDLDGVLTRTAAVHAAAWKEMFDDFLENWARRSGDPYVPFDIGTDYPDYVDGRPRADGVQAFLDSRGIHLPPGVPGDPPSGLTINALATRKNILLLQRMERDGVEVFEGSVRYLQALDEAGVPRAVVSSSANCAEVVRAAGIERLLLARIDGLVAQERGLAGKPAPDTYLAGAQALGVQPEAAAVFEDAVAGVQAGRAGAFGYVVGVDRIGHADALRHSGADIVVKDLADLLGGQALGAVPAGRTV